MVNLRNFLLFWVLTVFEDFEFVGIVRWLDVLDHSEHLLMVERVDFGTEQIVYW
jgi:hypothetical protein